MLRAARVTGSRKLHRGIVAVSTGGSGPRTPLILATAISMAKVAIWHSSADLDSHFKHLNQPQIMPPIVTASRIGQGRAGGLRSGGRPCRQAAKATCPQRHARLPRAQRWTHHRQIERNPAGARKPSSIDRLNALPPTGQWINTHRGRIEKLLAGACCWSGSGGGPCQGSKQVSHAKASVRHKSSQQNPTGIADTPPLRRLIRQGQAKSPAEVNLDRRPLTGGREAPCLRPL